MSSIVQLVPLTVGEGYRFETDNILEEAKGRGMTIVAVIGELPDGTTWVSGSANAGETLILMERAKRQIVFGEDGD